MEWLHQLSKAIDYMEDNLDDDISFEEVAKIACCSTFYFQRMFSYIAGISLSEYIRRRRMTLAAFDLQTSDMKIMDIAIKYGYKSPTAFNRAFQNIHGVAPTAARTQSTMLNAYPRISFSIHVIGDTNLRYRMEQKESFRVVGVRTMLKEDFEYNFQVIPQFWSKMFESSIYHEIFNLASQDANNILGVSSYIDPQNIFYYIAVSTDKAVPKGMLELEIPAATWVVFECDNNFKESVQSTFKAFVTQWLPFSGYEYAHLPDIEVYPAASDSTSHTEVWIAVKKPKNNN